MAQPAYNSIIFSNFKNLNNMKTLLPTSLLIALFLVGCKDPKKDNQAPNVSITSPVNGQSVLATDSFTFSGTASDDEDLHTGKLEIFLASNDSLLARKNVYVHQKVSYDFNEKFKISFAVATDVKARAKFEDHDGSVTTKEILFRITP